MPLSKKRDKARKKLERKSEEMARLGLSIRRETDRIRLGKLMDGSNA